MGETANLSQPADESLQAYISWIKGVSEGMAAARARGNQVARTSRSQDEWERMWRGYWEKRSGAGVIKNKRNWRVKPSSSPGARS